MTLLGAQSASGITREVQKAGSREKPLNVAAEARGVGSLLWMGTVAQHRGTSGAAAQLLRARGAHGCVTRMRLPVRALSRRRRNAMLVCVLGWVPSPQAGSSDSGTRPHSPACEGLTAACV